MGIRRVFTATNDAISLAVTTTRTVAESASIAVVQAMSSMTVPTMNQEGNARTI